MFHCCHGNIFIFLCSAVTKELMSVVMKYKDVRQPGCENAAKLPMCATPGSSTPAGSPIPLAVVITVL